MPRHDPYLPSEARGHRRRVEFLLAEVADAYIVEPQMILGRARRFRVALARHLVWHATRAVTGWSYPELGDYFRVDQSSARHGDKRITALRAKKPGLDAFVEALVQRAGALGQDHAIVAADTPDRDAGNGDRHQLDVIPGGGEGHGGTRRPGL